MIKYKLIFALFLSIFCFALFAQSSVPPTGEFRLITATSGGSGSPLLTGEGIQIEGQVLVDRAAIFGFISDYDALQNYVLSKYGQGQQLLIEHTSRENVAMSIRYSFDMANTLLYELRRIVNSTTYSTLRAKINAKHNEYQIMLKPLIKTSSSSGSGSSGASSSGGGGVGSTGSDRGGVGFFGGSTGGYGNGLYSGGGMVPDPGGGAKVISKSNIGINSISIQKSTK